MAETHVESVNEDTKPEGRSLTCEEVKNSSV